MVDLSGSPDFLKIAEAYGIKGETVSGNDRVEDAVKKMIEANEPYLLQVMVDRTERSLIE